MTRFNYFGYLQYVAMKREIFEKEMASKLTTSSSELDALVNSEEFKNIAHLPEEKQLELMQKAQTLSADIDLGFSEDLYVQNLGISPAEVKQFIEHG